MKNHESFDKALIYDEKMLKDHENNGSILRRKKHEKTLKTKKGHWKTMKTMIKRIHKREYQNKKIKKNVLDDHQEHIKK